MFVPTGPSAIATTALLGNPIRYCEIDKKGDGTIAISTVSIPSNKLSAIGVTVTCAEEAPAGMATTFEMT